MDEPKTFNKVVKRWGKSLVIVFNKEDLEILKLKEGNIIILQINNISKGKGDD